MSNDWPCDLPTDLERDYAHVVQRFQHPLAAYLFQFVNDREIARDLTQEVFMKAYRYLSSYDPKRSFSTWLFAIAANHARDHLRCKRVPFESLTRTSVPEVPTQDPQPDEVLIHAELSAELSGALARLTQEEREVVVLRHVVGFGIEEISQTIDIPPGTVKTRLFRARQRLQAILSHTNL